MFQGQSGEVSVYSHPQETRENNLVLQHSGWNGNFLFTPAVLKGIEIFSKLDKTEGRENNKDVEVTK